MCEFCPAVTGGWCAVCQRFTPQSYLKPPQAVPSSSVPTLDPESKEGFPIHYKGVTVRFDRHSDALACLTAIPQAKYRG